jgi:hypothetical protein
MSRLHEPQRGIPHEEFVRRKAHLRRLDAQLDLLRVVPWPSWVGPVLLLVPFPVTAGLGLLTIGPSASLLLPAILLVLLAIGVAYALVREAVDARRARRRGTPSVPDDAGEGPRLQLIVVTAAVVLPVLFLVDLAVDHSALRALADVTELVLLTSACFGAAITITRFRARRRPQAAPSARPTPEERGGEDEVADSAQRLLLARDGDEHRPAGALRRGDRDPRRRRLGLVAEGLRIRRA